MKKYIITSTNTENGKTFITCKLCRTLVNANKRVHVLKPIVSGWNAQDNDTIKLLDSLNIPITEQNIKKLSIYRLSAPLSLNIAAHLENITIDYNKILDFCNDYDESATLLIEGSGGIMSPINDNKTFLNLAVDLELEIILVISTELGTITSTLTAIKSIESYNRKVKAIIINENIRTDYIEETICTIKNFTDIPIYLIIHEDTEDSKEKNQESIDKIIETIIL